MQEKKYNTWEGQNPWPSNKGVPPCTLSDSDDYSETLARNHLAIYAITAASNLVVARSIPGEKYNTRYVAEYAYDIADEMLKIMKRA